MKNLTQKLMLNADLFASPPNMSLRGRYKIHSHLGFVLSLLVFTVGLWLFIYLGRDMFDKTNPRLSQISSASAKPVALDSERNVLRFGFLNGYGNWGYLFDERYFSIIAQTYKSPIDNYHSPTFTPITFEKCESVLYPGTDLICFKGYTAEGEPLVFGENVDSVMFAFNKCDPNVRSDCVDRWYLDTVITASRLQWENYDYEVDLDNHKKPFSQSFSPQDDPLDAESLTIVTYQNRYTTINSYDGWILTSPSIDQRTTMWSKTRNKSPIKDDGVFLRIEITKGGEHLKYYRQYPQIQNVLANVGGILSVLILVFRVLLLPYNQFIKESSIVKSIYKVKVPEKPGRGNTDSKNNNEKQEEIQGHSPQTPRQTQARLRLQDQLRTQKKFETLGEVQMTSGRETQRMISENQTERRKETNFVLSENEDGNLEIQTLSFPELQKKISPFERDEPFPEEGNQLASLSMSPSYWSPSANQSLFNLEPKPEKRAEIESQQKNIELEVGLLKWLVSFFKPQVEVEITKKALKEVEGNIDILNIIKMKREINLLKQVLLSDSQRALFDNIQPPQVSVGRNNKIEVETLLNHFEGDQVNAERIYRRLSRFDHKSQLDEKILAFYKKQK